MPSLFDGGDRIGWALKAWGDKPFYWLSPSGRERVLFWMAGRGYSWFHGLNMGSLAKAPSYRIFEYMDELAEKGYPYSMVQVRYTVGGDNGPPDPELADYVSEMERGLCFAQDRHRHGLRDVRGIRTAPRALSSPRSAAISPATGRTGRPRRPRRRPWPGRAPAASSRPKSLWSILGRPGFPAEKDEEAWRQVVLFSEHTWGASDSVSNPDGEGPRAQWEYKKAFAERAERMSNALLAAAAGSAAAPVVKYGRQAVDVVNTCSWERTDLVLVPRALWEAGERVEDETGAAVPSQTAEHGRAGLRRPGRAGIGGQALFPLPGTGGRDETPAGPTERGPERDTACGRRRRVRHRSAASSGRARGRTASSSTLPSSRGSGIISTFRASIPGKP